MQLCESHPSYEDDTLATDTCKSSGARSETDTIFGGAGPGATTAPEAGASDDAGSAAGGDDDNDAVAAGPADGGTDGYDAWSCWADGAGAGAGARAEAADEIGCDNDEMEERLTNDEVAR